MFRFLAKSVIALSAFALILYWIRTQLVAGEHGAAQFSRVMMVVTAVGLAYFWFGSTIRAWIAQQTRPEESAQESTQNMPSTSPSGRPDDYSADKSTVKPEP